MTTFQIPGPAALKQLYEPLYLAEFEPGDCYARRHWVDSLALSFSMKMFRMAYAVNMATMNFAGRLLLLLIKPEIIVQFFK